MKLELLITLVKSLYEEIYNEKAQSVEKLDDLIYEVKFENETIRVDRATGNRYRLTFEKLMGTIDEFRKRIDKGMGIEMYACDASYFIDLTESQINQVANKYNI